MDRFDRNWTSRNDRSMQAQSGNDAACDTGRNILLARSEAVVDAQRGRPAVVGLAVERHERLRAPQGVDAASLERNTGEATEE